MIEENKITMMGDPVWHGKWARPMGALLSLDARVVAISTLFYGVAMSLCSPTAAPADVLVPLAKMAPLIASAGFLSRWCTCLHWHRLGVYGSAKDKVINVRPDNKTQPTSVKWMLFSLLEREKAKSGLFFNGGFFVSLILTDVIFNPSVKSVISSIAVMAPYIAHDVYRLYRSSKVLDRSWVVEDKGPPPERVPVREKISKLFGVWAPAPSGA